MMCRLVPWAVLVAGGALGLACGATGEPQNPPSSGVGGNGASANGTGSAPSWAGAGILNDAGVLEPPSTVVDPVGYTSSCETEQCTADEKCLECTFGTCCAKSCGQQLPCPAGEVTYCDRQGGAIVCGAP
jgi:hypothetical protein